MEREAANHNVPLDILENILLLQGKQFEVDLGLLRLVVEKLYRSNLNVLSPTNGGQMREI